MAFAISTSCCSAIPRPATARRGSIVRTQVSQHLARLRVHPCAIH